MEDYSYQQCLAKGDWLRNRSSFALELFFRMRLIFLAWQKSMFTFEIWMMELMIFRTLNTQLQIEIVNESKIYRMRHKLFIEIKEKNNKKKEAKVMEKFFFAIIMDYGVNVERNTTNGMKCEYIERSATKEKCVRLNSS